MKFTTLYLHDSTACWMQWRGKRLLQTYSESITREFAERAASMPKKEGIPSLCPWLSVHASQVRLLIDPVTDQTRSVPAFDHGFTEPCGKTEQLRQSAEQMYLTCRSLTSDVLADDLTRYRHDKLDKYPNALLQWHQSAPTGANVNQVRTPRHWLVSDSGLSDYVFTWLSAMADHGLEFVDVRTVSGLFAAEDADSDSSVITIFEQPNRCRLFHCDAGFVLKVDQWSNPVEARIALADRVAEFIENDDSVELRYVGADDGLSVWQETMLDLDIKMRADGITDKANYSDSLHNDLPDACLHLPLGALIRSQAVTEVSVWSATPKWEAGTGIRKLLSIAKWKKRYKRTLIATTFAAVFSGYFVLLACMHAVKIIELHQRADTELQLLNDQKASMQKNIEELTHDSEQAVASINRLLAFEEHSIENNLKFIQSLAEFLNSQPRIQLNSVSWRLIVDKMDEDTLAILAKLNELIDHYEPEQNSILSNGESESISSQYGLEHIVLISGNVVSQDSSSLSQQQASDFLIEFLQGLSSTNQVIDVLPVLDSMALTPKVNMPSDVVLNSNSNNSFVVAVRLSV